MADQAPCPAKNASHNTKLRGTLENSCKYHSEDAYQMQLFGSTMLIRFAVANFRSIEERQELSLVPSGYYKDRPEILLPSSAPGVGPSLPLAVIYGPNAAGKTT